MDERWPDSDPCSYRSDSPLFFCGSHDPNVPEEVVGVARQGQLFMLPWAGFHFLPSISPGHFYSIDRPAGRSQGTILRMIYQMLYVTFPLLAMIPGINGLAVATAAQGFSVFLEGAICRNRHAARH